MTNRTLYLVFHMRYVCSTTVCGTEDLPGLIVIRVVSFLVLEAIPVSALPEPSTASHGKTSTLCIVPGAGCQVWSEWECSFFGCNRIYFYFVCTMYTTNLNLTLHGRRSLHHHFHHWLTTMKMVRLRYLDFEAVMADSTCFCRCQSS